MSDAELFGYVDRWSARPGETLTFHVSCTAGAYSARLVRLRHGDTNPAGPGLVEIPVESPFAGNYRGSRQTIPNGSCVSVSHLPPLERFTLALWAWPTLID